MSSWQIWLVVFGLAAAGWLIFSHGALDAPSPAEWEVEATAPRRIGTADDPYAYAGGEAVRPILGTAELRAVQDGTSAAIVARLTLLDDAGLEPIRPDDEPIRELELQATGATAFWTDETIYGETERGGDEALPQTDARIAGVSDATLSINGVARPGPLTLVWSVADALRREDGSIGQQGLIFSPLLREKAGFSDPGRMECTLILHDADAVILHVVFSEVTILASPDG
jgi:hypothetical protein